MGYAGNVEFFLSVLVLGFVVVQDVQADRRVPAEWEEQTGVWMQWPKGWEVSYRPNFAGIIDAVVQHEPLHLIVNSNNALNQAQNYLSNAGVPLDQISFHIMPYNWAWMRDNGPVWVDVDGEMVVEDWGFDCWGGIDSPCNSDDAVPCAVAQLEGAPCEDHNDLIVERGALEFNGVDTLISTWPVFADRNPGVTKPEMEALLSAQWGVSNIIWLEVVPPSDVFTGGHVDGIARFIDEDTVVVNRCNPIWCENAVAYDDAAQRIGDAGFEVIRFDEPGQFMYQGVPVTANYINWLVINDAVIVGGFNQPKWDAQAKKTIESFFPDREVHVVDIREVWWWGGGVHCVTNDRPALVDATVAGDVNGDGVVNTTDILELIASWGPCNGCNADLDGNGDVDVGDLLIVIENWS
jgi:agmatine deiminase